MSNQNEYTVKITPNAIANIKEIMDFYIDAMNWPPAAVEFKDAFQAKLPVIQSNPHMYGIPDNLPQFAALGYRKAPVYKHHVILYVIDEDAKLVHIIYVADTRKNLWLATPIKLLK